MGDEAEVVRRAEISLPSELRAAEYIPKSELDLDAGGACRDARFGQ